MRLYLYFLLVASGIMILSLTFIIPTLNTVIKTKKDLFQLFMLKKLQEYIGEEVELIKRFLVT